MKSTHDSRGGRFNSLRPPYCFCSGPKERRDVNSTTAVVPTQGVVTVVVLLTKLSPPTLTKIDQYSQKAVSQAGLITGRPHSLRPSAQAL
jgi:hypothetical protein